MDTRIAAMIAANKVGAIALDTSVIDAQQRNLEGGLLRRVEQFHRSDRVRVLIPDVVRREVEAHLTRDAAEARRSLGALCVWQAGRSCCRITRSSSFTPSSVSCMSR